MISRLHGTVLDREGGVVEVETASGVVYEVDVPTTVLQRLPGAGEPVKLRTVQVVREDSVALYGFLDAGERELFRRLLSASGVGAKLALSMLSAYTAPRLAQALAEKDVVALRQISGVGKKTAERLVLELADKVGDLTLALDGDGSPAPRGAQEAVAALLALGYDFSAADRAVRAALEEGEAESAEQLIRRALSLQGA
ncbi:MAG: Holliday junction branch migration protein RuvA [Gemmatimonadota bacterium]